MSSSTSTNESQTKRNTESIIAFYELMLNQRKPVEAVSKYLVNDYIQHNPLIPTGAQGLAGFFEFVMKSRPLLRVKVHKIIAEGNYVWAHVNFINIYNDDPNDRGIAGVDIYRFNDDGKVVEHWDVLQEVVDPSTAANSNGMF